MKKAMKNILAAAFILMLPFACFSSSFDPHHSFYFGPHTVIYTYVRYIIIVLLLLFTVFLNRRNYKLITYYTPCVICLTSLFAYIDYFITEKLVYNYFYLFMFGISISVCAFSVFLGYTLFIKEGYNRFFKLFWFSYLLIYLLIIYVAFIRNPDSYDLSVNTQLGNGTLKFFKYILSGKDTLYLSYICLGNIFILSPLPFIIKAINSKAPIILYAASGALMPLLFEGYQYLLKCGNVDIDDLVLNWLGFILGCIILKIISTKKDFA